MLSTLMNKLFGSGKQSKSLAKSRLHFVLVQDRAGLSNEEMIQFKRELVQVVERYFVIDKQGFDIAYEREKETTTLLINSPVIVRRQDSIDYQVGSRKKRKQSKAKKRTVQQAAV